MRRQPERPWSGRPLERKIGFDNLLTVRVGRSRDDRLDGQPSLVLERRTGQTVRIASVAQPGTVSELAQRLVGLQLGHAGVTQRALVVVPLVEGARARARELVESGPPFDAARAGLVRHHVFLLDDAAVFLFETDCGLQALEELLAEPGLWRSAGAWRDLISRPPQLAEDVFSWVKPANGSGPRIGLGF